MIFKHSKTDNPAVHGCMEIVAGLFLGAIFCLIISLCSCKPVKEVQIERVEVPVPIVQEHTIEQVRVDHVRDTLIQRDSVFYCIKGDTVTIEKWHYLQGKTNAVRIDTLIKTDSVQVPVEVVRESVKTEIKEVEKKLNWWQKTLMIIGGLTIIGSLLLATYKLRRK